MTAVAGGGDPDTPTRQRAGLCGRCLHRRVVMNRRGSVFYMCRRSVTDPAYPRYPPLPVLSCAGFEDGGVDPFEEESG